MDRFINLGLMKNPVNWVIILSMVALGAMAVHVLFGFDNSADRGQGE